MRIIRTLFLVILLIASRGAMAQSEVELAVQLMVPDVIAEKCLDAEPFYTWLKGSNEVYEAELKATKGDFEALLLFNLNDSGTPEISLSCKPPIEDADRLRILNKIKAQPGFNTKFGEYTFFIRAKVGKGSRRQGDNYYPPVVFPREKRIQAFHAMSLKEKATYLKQWTDEKVIPVLSMFQLAVDPQFEGVLGVGKVLDSKAFEGQSTNSFIDTNYVYWRAMLEMSKGNQLIPFSRICMHLSNQEWDIAGNYIQLTKLFSSKNSVATYYMEELEDLLKILKDQVNMEIEEGIRLFDEGKLDEARFRYGAIYRSVPKSAFLNYEMYLTDVTIALNKDSASGTSRNIWEKYREAIYSSDPMYSIMAQANSADEGYELACRGRVKGLFKDKDQTKNDLLRYADLAVELEDYGFAAHIYWWLFTYLGNEAYDDRAMLDEFLYALDKLGDDRLKQNFEGDFKKTFRQIDKRRQALKEADPMYQAFAR